MLCCFWGSSRRRSLTTPSKAPVESSKRSQTLAHLFSRLARRPAASCGDLLRGSKPSCFAASDAKELNRCGSFSGVSLPSIQRNMSTSRSGQQPVERDGIESPSSQSFDLFREQVARSATERFARGLV